MPTLDPPLADRKVFEAKRSASSVTGESKAVEGLVEGRHITVVDTPGTPAYCVACCSTQIHSTVGRGADSCPCNDSRVSDV